MPIDFSQISWRVSPQRGHWVQEADRGRAMNDVKADAKAIFLEAPDCKRTEELVRFLPARRSKNSFASSTGK